MVDLTLDCDGASEISSHIRVERLTKILQDEAILACRLLSSHGRRLATAESCTGGLIAAAITDIPGASTVFERGIVAYSNDSKIDWLTVPLVFIEQYGAVSPQTASAMAEGALLVSRADIAVSVTGIAGPGGGGSGSDGDNKPIGLVYIGLAEKDSGKPVLSQCCRFEGGRKEVRLQAAFKALQMVTEHLQKEGVNVEQSRVIEENAVV